MAQNSKIEWTHHTCNLWHGCTEVHSGCDNCYARVLDNRFGSSHWGNESPRKYIKSVWGDFRKYQKLAQQKNETHKVFVGSMMDIFEKPMPLVDSKGLSIPNGGMTTGDLRKIYFDIVIPETPNLMHLLLTKRPSNINKYIPESWKTNPPHNVMFGTSPVDQATADKLIPQLLEVNGKLFLSIEPMLGQIDLTQWLGSGSQMSDTYKCPSCEFIADKQFMTASSSDEDGTEYYSQCQKCGAEVNDENMVSSIAWIICGGESGASKRPFNIDWARDVKAQCIDKIPFFMKQIDKVQPIPDDLMIREFPKHEGYQIPIDTTPIVRKNPVKRVDKRYFVYDFRKKFFGEFNEEGVSNFVCMEITSIDSHVRHKTIAKGLYRIYSEKQHE